jgi:acetyl esterase
MAGFQPDPYSMKTLFMVVSLSQALTHASMGGTAEPTAQAAQDPPSVESHTYKTSLGEERRMEIHFPPSHDPSKAKVPGLILFHGGGWTRGNLRQFREHCSYFASRGLVCATVEYRLPDKAAVKAMPKGQSHKRLCVTDAKSAIRWFKQNADKLGIDPGRIITGGGSAGGHISALATMNPGLNDPADPQDIDTKVVAYLWFNPAFAPEDKRDPEIDILTHAKADLPPAIVFFGDKDRWLTGWNAAHAKWKKLGVKHIDLRIAEGQEHSFFNKPDWRTVTLIAADGFLVEHGLLTGKPTLSVPAGGEKLVAKP